MVFLMTFKFFLVIEFEHYYFIFFLQKFVIKNLVVHPELGYLVCSVFVKSIKFFTILIHFYDENYIFNISHELSILNAGSTE